MTINGKQKGARGEREVVKLLKSWWAQVEPTAEFYRQPLSGGWGSLNVRGKLRACGDIGTTSETFCFTVEVKLRESWSPEALAAGHRSPVWRWWMQAVKAAKEEGNIPLLIFRKNRYPWHIIIPEIEATRVTIASPVLTWKKFSKGVNVCPWPICFLAQDVFAEHPAEVTTRLRK